jgi:hypothetical protein
MIFAGQRFVDQPAGSDLNSPDFADYVFRQHNA